MVRHASRNTWFHGRRAGNRPRHSITWTWRLLALAGVIAAGPAHVVLGQDAASAPASTTQPGQIAGVANADNQLTEAEHAAGWLLLFDGETLFGWQPNGNANWSAEDGEIRVSSGEVCLLETFVPFANFEFACDFQAPLETNSGVFFRTLLQPREVTRDCYELNIAGPGVSPFTTGSLVGRAKAEVPAIQTPASGELPWQHFHVRANAGKWEVELNGQSVLKYEDPQPREVGLIGLQHNHGRVAFKNVKLRPLGLEPLFNGKDLSGWKIYPDKPAQFTITPAGELSIRNGNGQLESEHHFDNFVLQTEVFVNGDGLNSGIFFRAIPGEFSNGYESQIQNGFKNGDRTKPVDFGTGAIYRRIPARKVVSDDRVWFQKTLVASGPRIAVWVNGYLVTAWEDQRPPHPNPRNGQRLQAGSLIFQAHDPGTDLLFRKVQLAPLPVFDPSGPAPPTAPTADSAPPTLGPNAGSGSSPKSGSP